MTNDATNRAATRIKICGLTREADVVGALEAGADAIGLAFPAISRRQIDPATAARLSAVASGAACRVGLFVDAPAGEVAQILDQVELDLLQFHGAESAEYCGQFGVPYMKAHRVRGPQTAATLAAAHPDAAYLLLDAYVEGQPGGTGQQFPWRYWPEDADTVAPGLVLAGGLNPANVATAVRQLRPFAVDVSGGVEDGPGLKSRNKIEQFIQEVRRADAGQ